MRFLVVYAHPVETSYHAALHRKVVETLAASGHSVDDCDLYNEGFDPVMRRDERARYHDTAVNRSLAPPISSASSPPRRSSSAILSGPTGRRR